MKARRKERNPGFFIFPTNQKRVGLEHFVSIYLGIRWVKDAIATGLNYVVVIFWLRGRGGERGVSVSTTVRSCDPTCLLRTEYDIIE